MNASRYGFFFLSSISFVLALFWVLLYHGNTTYQTAFYVLLGSSIMSYLFLFMKERLFYLNVFLIPLSVGLEMGGSGMSLSFPSELLIFCFSGVYLANSLFHPPNIKVFKHPLTLLILLDLTWILIASLNSTSPDVSLKRWIMKVNYVLVFFLLGSQLLKQPKQLIKSVLLYSLGLSIVVILTLINHSQYNFDPRATFNICAPYFSEHTLYGACLAFVLPFLMMAYWNKRSWQLGTGTQMLLAYLVVIILLGELMAFSRAAWLSLCVTLLFYGLIRLRIKTYMVLALLGLSSLIIYVNGDDLYMTVYENESVSNDGNVSTHITSITNIKSDASNLERINRWVCAIRMFNDKPITGFGPGTYQFEYGQYQTSNFKTYISTNTGDKGNAHSEYLGYLSETGLPGLIIFLCLVMYTIHLGLNLIYRARSAIIRQLATATLLALCTFFFHGLVNSFIDQDNMAFLVFTSMAILLSIDLYHKDLSDQDISNKQLS